jgi:pyruvate,water dikinase
MNLVISLERIHEAHRAGVGGKGYALAMMAQEGLVVPKAVCITTEAYNEYVDLTGIRGQILLELQRKSFDDMRWEEVWDVSLRIRHLFMNTDIPNTIKGELEDGLEAIASTSPVSVRSSAPGEDSVKTSFAGLHESYVNLKGRDRILEHIRLVWASLWSDRALLYRRELGLDLDRSAMAVVVQEMVFGDRSGIVFGKSPVDDSQAVIESVYGLNQGLVDGTIEPDRWELDRSTGEIISHLPVVRERSLEPAPEGTRVREISSALRSKAPLGRKEIREIFEISQTMERLFGAPQDVEWTFRKGALYALQSRPITSPSVSEDDQRPWYLSLQQSFQNLKSLKKKIESELIPAMEAEAKNLAQRELKGLSDHQLADEVNHRVKVHERWLEDYRRYCIPFAHGMRLFGQIYTDRVRPKDPFEFMNLLVGTAMVSTLRNQVLEDLAARIRQDQALFRSLKEHKLEACDPEFKEAFDRLIIQYGDTTWGAERFAQSAERILKLLLEMASRPPKDPPTGFKGKKRLEERFFSAFTDDEMEYAEEILDIARASYRLRDDDNTYLGKIEGQLQNALSEAKNRLKGRSDVDNPSMPPEEVVKALKGRHGILKKEAPVKEIVATNTDFRMQARQLIGQPAGPGVAVGKARIILNASDLFSVKSGEILVCDAIDPNMTFVVPLVSGIVERRGGMLIHGAIIAREYGIPCVTGVADVTSLVETGDLVTVDGHLGIIIIAKDGRQSIPSKSRDGDKETGH